MWFSCKGLGCDRQPPKLRVVPRPVDIPGWGHQPCRAPCAFSLNERSPRMLRHPAQPGHYLLLTLSQCCITPLFPPSSLFSCVSTSFFPVFILYLSFFPSPLTFSLLLIFFSLSLKPFNKQSKQKGINKTFQVGAKQAIPTEHFSCFHDSIACVPSSLSFC